MIQEREYTNPYHEFLSFTAVDGDATMNAFLLHLQNDQQPRPTSMQFTPRKTFCHLAERVMTTEPGASYLVIDKCMECHTNVWNAMSAITTV